MVSIFRTVASFAVVLFAGSLAASAHQATFTVTGETFVFEIAPEMNAGYDRDDWPHWDEGLGGGCFTVRDKVLAEESFVPVETVPASGGRCRVVKGLWNDPYTGLTFTESSDVDIDHVVPLKEAHGSGGHAWTRERRRAYANYLNYSHHLIVVDDRENQTVKRDRDPAEYLPIGAFECEYVEVWLRIKRTWGLNMDQTEVDAINAVLAGC